MKVEQQILQILSKNKEVRLHDLVEQTGASRQMIHRILKSLTETGSVIKIGTAPRTFYKLGEGPKPNTVSTLTPTEETFLKEHFLLVTETGIKLSGPAAFSHWCTRQKLTIDKTAREFIATRKKYLHHYTPSVPSMVSLSVQSLRISSATAPRICRS